LVAGRNNFFKRKKAPVFFFNKSKETWRKRRRRKLEKEKAGTQVRRWWKNVGEERWRLKSTLSQSVSQSVSHHGLRLAWDSRARRFMSSNLQDSIRLSFCIHFSCVMMALHAFSPILFHTRKCILMLIFFWVFLVNIWRKNRLIKL